MPPPYIDKHWSVFSGIPHVDAGKIGFAPATWAAQHGLNDVADNLPSNQLSRLEVRDFCRDGGVCVLYGYLCAMAWGSQGAGPGGSKYVRSAWGQRELLLKHLTALRQGGLSRSEAYKLFVGEGRISGLGPAYWTKLLYFFSPKPDFFIMDQWTGKSVNLLTGRQLVRMAGDAASPKNKCGNYQAYCEEIDKMAGLLDLAGADVEEMLMSKGGKKPWPWRAHLKQHYDYNPSLLHGVYPHIAQDDF